MLKKYCSYLAVLTLMFLVSVAAGCGSDKGTTDTGKETANTQAAGSVAVGSTKGAQAPDFTLKRVAGGELTLSDLRGKAVIVDFWDTWCPPCRRALPHLQELSEEYHDDLVVVAVAFGREGAAKVGKYVADNGLTFETVLFDPQSSVLRDFGGISSIPTTFLIDENGIIREKWVGGADKSSYENAVITVINNKTKAG